MQEEWRSVTAEEFINIYHVSDFGRIKRVAIDSLGRNRFIRHMLKPQLRKGYLKVNLRIGFIRRSFTLSRLVAGAFLDLDLNSDFEINHKDGNKLNNYLSNLEIVTRLQNQQHAICNGLFTPGLYCKGENSPLAKLTNEQVSQIRFENNLGISQRELAQKI